MDDIKRRDRRFCTKLSTRRSRDERCPIGLETRFILRADRGSLPKAKGYAGPGNRAGPVVRASLLRQHLADVLEGVFPADAGMNRDAAALLFPQVICVQGRQSVIDGPGQHRPAYASGPTRTGDDQCVVACELSAVKILSRDQIRL